MSSEQNHVELLQGTLDLIVLRALSTMGPLHAYALAARLAQVSDHPLSLNQGTLYPALVRLEHGADQGRVADGKQPRREITPLPSPASAS
jgi:DNA-binding PadR family transcriptional regulator